MLLYAGGYTEDISTQEKNGSKGIYILHLDEEEGSLKVIAADNSVISPSFLCISEDKKLLLAAGERLQDGSLASFEIRENGLLKLTDRVSLSGSACCFVTMPRDRRFAAAVHYGSGEVFSYELDPAGIFGNRAFSHHNTGTGPNPDRQERSHCHSCRLMESKGIMVLCDLGNDTVSFWTYHPDGGMTPEAIPTIHTPPGTGPRHCEFTEDGNLLYITAELSNEVLVYRFADGAYQLQQRITTLPEDYKGTNTAADIHYSQRKDQIYVSNRGNDSVAVYDVAADGSLRIAGFSPTGGKTPRNFAVTEKYLISANQDSGQVIVQKLKEDGIPGEITSVVEIPAVACVLAAE